MEWTLVAYAKERNKIVSAAEVGLLSYIQDQFYQYLYPICDSSYLHHILFIIIINYKQHSHICQRLLLDKER